MSNFLKDLKSRARDPRAIYHKFRTSNLLDENHYYFVEGYEDKEYLSFVCQSLEQKSISTICFGKKNLDKVYDEFLKSPVTRVPVKFVRDRDFDRFLNRTISENHLFLTCGYSIENYICSNKSLKRFIDERMSLSDSEIDVDEILSRFTSIVTALHQWLKPLYKLIFAAIDNLQEFDLNKFNVGKYIKDIVNQNTQITPENLPELKAVGLNKITPSDRHSCLSNEYCEIDPFMAIRGKYLLSITTEFLRGLADFYAREHKEGRIFNFNRSICSQINSERVFSDLAVRSPPTERLRSMVLSEN